MKKVLKFVIHNRKTIIEMFIVGVVSVVLYEIAHNVATLERGYEAVGGEMFIPLLIIFAKPIWEMIKEPFKAVKK